MSPAGLQTSVFLTTVPTGISDAFRQTSDLISLRSVPIEASCASIHGEARPQHLNKAGPVGGWRVNEMLLLLPLPFDQALPSQNTGQATLASIREMGRGANIVSSAIIGITGVTFVGHAYTVNFGCS
ncbi:hypothetical protein BDV28DRAFT_145763 [Aspergillus coremiiformis]|uniref:Uncharacterized protein n=1 Tax=Aspergillus coremiiformis TaxID=138285 RepID=A0A5N6ZE65_9EURO|nr:hypothetical protein BDV28DRAFT_145763 [Aspergillus coremiiformis]